LRLSKVDEEEDAEDVDNIISTQQQELRRHEIEELARQEMPPTLRGADVPVFGFQARLPSSPPSGSSLAESTSTSTCTPRTKVSPATSAKGRYSYSPLSLGRSRTRSNTINIDDAEVKDFTDNLDRLTFQSSSSNQSGKLTKTKSSDSILDRLIINFEKKNSDANLFEDLTSPTTPKPALVPPVVSLPRQVHALDTRSQHRDHPLSFTSGTPLGTETSLLLHSTGTGTGSTVNHELEAGTKANTTSTSTSASLSTIILADNEGNREDQDQPLRPASSSPFHNHHNHQQQLAYQLHEIDPLNQRSSSRTEIAPEITSNPYRLDSKLKRNGSSSSSTAIPSGVGFDPLSVPSSHSHTGGKYPPADTRSTSTAPQSTLYTNNSSNEGSDSNYIYQNNNEQAMLSQRKSHVKHRFSDTVDYDRQ